MITAKVAQFGDGPAGSFPFRLAGPAYRIATYGVVACDGVDNGPLAVFVHMHQPSKVPEHPFLVLATGRLHISAQPSELLMLVE
jgi:hypothetical protein